MKNKHKERGRKVGENQVPQILMWWEN